MKNTKYIILAIVILVSACGKIPESVTGNYNGHDFVDMGTSVMWATCNVGAQMPTEYGDYVAWGEIESKEYYAWKSYKYGYSINSLTKYCTNPEFGNVDNLLVLQPEDDYAFIKWGEKWRTATKEEWDELIEGCTWECVTTPSVMMSYCDDCEEIVSFGLVGTSKYNGLKIYFPKNISKFGNSFTIATKYWTSSVYEDNHFEAWLLYTEYGESSAEFNSYHDSRYLGCSIRPVTSKK